MVGNPSSKIRGSERTLSSMKLIHATGLLPATNVDCNEILYHYIRTVKLFARILDKNAWPKLY